MCEWKPIETAPKDYQEVFLWLPEIPGEQRARWIRSRWMDYGYWGNEHSNGPAYNINSQKHPVHGYNTAKYDAVKPSHWMPLPIPPKDS